MVIIVDDVLNEWTIYSANDFMARFGIDDDLDNFASDDDLIVYYLEKDSRKFKLDFRWSKEYHDDCWFIKEIK